MGPTPETCGELLRPLRALLGFKQFAAQHSSEFDAGEISQAAAGLLAELRYRGECRASDLAAYRVVDASVVSRQLGQLEETGLITRRPDPNDRRVALLRTTPAGENELTRIEQCKSEWLSHALHRWDEGDVRRLAELLGSAAADIRQAVHESSCPSDSQTQEGTR